MSDQPPTNKGKQPQVDSDDDDEQPGAAPEAGAGGDGAEEDQSPEKPGAATASGGGSKKKRSKRKKIKDALGGGPKLSADTNMASAVDGLSEKQVAELLALNPALAEEVAAAKKAGTTATTGTEAGESSSAAAELLKRLSLQDIMTGLASSGKNAKDMASYKFWQTQPVMKFGEAPPAAQNVEEGPVKVQAVEDVSKEPPPMVQGFEWVTVDMTSDEEVKEVFELLYGHYVEDDAAMFRFNYSLAILRWALMSPGWKKQWHVGVRATVSRKLVAFIAAVPSKIRVRDKTLDASEVNFICVHKKLRGKRLAPVLIKEVTRLINLENVWQAIYTAGVVLPKPVSTCRYFHRALDWQKLYEVGFSPLPAGSKPQYQVRKFALPENTSVKGLREMRESDVEGVHALLGRYLQRYDLAPVYEAAEVRHWMLPASSTVAGGGEQVVWSYVVEDPAKKGHLTDFFSFYALESSVINNAKHQNVRAAYLFYYATDVAFRVPFDRAALATRLNELVHDALILAKRFKFDVFNAISLMDNALFLEQQKFGPGDGQLHYYLFNYRANPISGGVDRRNMLDADALSGVGFVMM